ncbi:MAG: ROK family protein [Arachnia propionica]|uniref:ROK family protein n=1 Tax=Arachnia propionica TaxID=1750 RepID=UPI00270E7FC2|nr:ROK family protein [Arachnia propionica]
MTPDRGADPAVSALAIDIGGTKTAFARVSATGDILDSFRVATPTATTPRDLALERLREHVRRTLRWSSRFQLCVVVRPGLLAGEDVVELSPNTPAWQDTALAGLLRQELGDLSIRFENDVRAAAHAEVTTGQLRGVDPGLYVNLGTGVAAALVVHGRILVGAHRAAGEIGYMRPDPLSGSTAPEGFPAPLEELLGGQALGRRASRLLGRQLGARELFEATDPLARAVVGQSALLLATMLGNLCTLVDPELIVFGGGLAGSFQHWAPIVRAHLVAGFPCVPELRVSRHLTDGSLVGAATLCRAELAGGRQEPCVVKEG